MKGVIKKGKTFMAMEVSYEATSSKIMWKRWRYLKSCQTCHLLARDSKNWRKQILTYDVVKGIYGLKKKKTKW